eukprot:UN4371
MRHGRRGDARSARDVRERVLLVPRYEAVGVRLHYARLTFWYEAVGVRQHMQERLHGLDGRGQRRYPVRPWHLLRRVQYQERRVCLRRPFRHILGALRYAALPGDVRARPVYGLCPPQCG